MQAVKNVASSGKVYMLPPDKENTAAYEWLLRELWLYLFYLLCLLITYKLYLIFFFFLAGVNHLSLPLRKHSLTSVTKRPTPSIFFVSFFYALLADIVIMIDSRENAIYCKLSFEVKCYWKAK